MYNYFTLSHLFILQIFVFLYHSVFFTYLLCFSDLPLFFIFFCDE